MTTTDLIIIGAGPGGYRAAEYAAKHGMTVVIFEGDDVGGTCLNVGCIPTKVYVHSTSFDEARERIGQVVPQLRSGVESILSHPNITLIREKALFVDSNTVEASLSGEVWRGNSIIIATGCVRGDGNSYGYVPAEYPAIADPFVTKALIMAAKEFGEDPIVGLYRAHDSYYRETSTAMIDTYERMKPWVDAGVKMVENESATLFTVGPQLGLRCGSICVSHTSMVEDTVYYTGPKSEEAYPEAFEDDFMDKRILVCSRIAVRAAEIIAEMEKKGVIR